MGARKGGCHYNLHEIPRISRRGIRSRNFSHILSRECARALANGTRLSNSFLNLTSWHTPLQVIKKETKAANKWIRESVQHKYVTQAALDAFTVNQETGRFFPVRDRFTSCYTIPDVPLLSSHLHVILTCM